MQQSKTWDIYLTEQLCNFRLQIPGPVLLGSPTETSFKAAANGSAVHFPSTKASS